MLGFVGLVLAPLAGDPGSDNADDPVHQRGKASTKMSSRPNVDLNAVSASTWSSYPRRGQRRQGVPLIRPRW